MGRMMKLSTTNKDVLLKMSKVYNELFNHDGFGTMKVEVRILKRGQKEIIIHCGKQHRFVVDYPTNDEYEIEVLEKALSK